MHALVGRLGVTLCSVYASIDDWWKVASNGCRLKSNQLLATATATATSIVLKTSSQNNYAYRP